MKAGVYLSLLVILIIAIVLRIHIISNIFINAFITEPLFITDLLGKGVIIPWRVILLLDLCNIFLFFLVGSKIQNIKFGLLTSLLYGIIPWVAYAQLFGSIYIFFLFFLLIFFYGATLLKESRRGIVIIIASNVVLLYSSLFSWFILPFLILVIHEASINKTVYLRLYLPMIFIVFLSVLMLSSKNITGIKNIYQNQIGFLSGPELKNSINSFRGESQQAGFGSFSKLGENRYIYLSNYFVLKLFKNIVPSTYFTPQEKLFNFSFSPPIYIGFLIPFMYGIYNLLKSSSMRRYLLVSPVFLIPSVLAKPLVDMERLVIMVPVAIFIITYGLMLLLNYRKQLIFRLFFFGTLLLVLLQLSVTQSDIALRESTRYNHIFSQDTRVGQQ